MINDALPSALYYLNNNKAIAAIEGHENHKRNQFPELDKMSVDSYLICTYILFTPK